MDYLRLLQHSFDVTKLFDQDKGITRLEFLSTYIFGFTTYDSELDCLMAERAVEVCEAINNRTTFDYIKDPDKYVWYIIMCNMPFFIDKLEWGTSVRGAWWDLHGDKTFKLDSCGLWDGDNQLEGLEFNELEWRKFVKSMVAFIKE